ncbi:uncharacterized protein L969DRAFT_121876 [Mixia osmundae IAM 14324]|uniref:histone deacetylase n=1 Tax=Mixia osmundae (strain CBS 9802 / IAM 14324 / JCM 22182 / KY 12970) TaxID=764103 RepID=G7E414_MIXOS|nr:uncharacterized protein L969DRAFT_121876 [Mixia osmundae IAM 14324]KEI42020.1 hypothetical protein L969DRAFT_121876 [Mixia osmundae IAM 14324]GAA97574.1 hypothetical protein E5Q_04252 [Mixia osmundae IAM 14324]
MAATPAKKRIAYYHDDDIGAYSYTYVHPMKPHRIRMAHNLIVNYGLDKKMDVLRPERASPHSMTAFHTDEYINFLTTVTSDTLEELTGHGTRFLIGEDCPAFDGLFEFCSISAGGSISSARRLNDGQADIAINWAGGLHHAKKREASGFCYVNDIVLAILELLRFHARVLYIDIDIHHGDGVEEAFYTTDRVMTCSFHKFGDYFPGTGALGDQGIGKGKGYAINVPLRDGIEDESYHSMFKPIIQHLMDWYRPGAVILQCGADSLAEDKLGCFNLSMRGHAECVQFMKTFDVPLIVLGGGGYTIRNVARTWAYETGILAGVDMNEDLPFNDYIEYYGPAFKLDVPNNNMDNLNSPQYLESIKVTIMETLKQMPFAPSAPNMPVPREVRLEEDLDSDLELDTRISQKTRDAFTERYGDTLSDDEDDMPFLSPPPKVQRLNGNGHRHGRGRRKKVVPQNGFEEDTTAESDSDRPSKEPIKPKRTFFAANGPRPDLLTAIRSGALAPRANGQ